MSGILIVKPIISTGNIFQVNETLQKEALGIWCNSSQDNSTCPENISDVSTFAMYTFDAAWTLIQALNKSLFDKSLPSMERSNHCFNSVLKNSNNYHMHLRNTKFLGVSGIVQFSKNVSNDRLEGACYALYNMQMRKNKPKHKKIMIWYGTTHRWVNTTDEDKISITWPGNEPNKIPTDYLQLRG